MSIQNNTNITDIILKNREKAYDEYNEGNYELAFMLFMQLAEKEDAESENNLGFMYENGIGIAQSVEEAAKWYKKAAEQGFVHAQYSLGTLYANGDGVPQSHEEAAKWYRLAADQNLVEAQNILGWIYMSGKGVPQSYEEAAKWYRLAADQGDAEAQFCLSNMYENGTGVQQSNLESVKWCKLAAEGGFAFAQNKLGFMYEVGIDVPQSNEEAAKWYLFAAEQGDSQALNNLLTLCDDPEVHLSIDDVERLNRLMTELICVEESDCLDPISVEESCIHQPHGNPFDEIFKRLSVEEFMADPTKILPLLLDYGFNTQQVGILEKAMSEDMEDVKEFLRSRPDFGYFSIGNIAAICHVSREALTDILDRIRSSMHSIIEKNESKIIDDEKYGKCRISADGVAKYSLDMAKLLHVEDVDYYTIPNSVKEIGISAFSDCSSLKEVHIPNSVTKIGQYAFENCSSLEKVHIPDSVTEIACDAFSSDELVSFEVDEGNEYYSSESGALFDKKKELLIVGYPLVHDGKCTIPDSVTKIGDGAFWFCWSLKEVHIPDSVKEIDDDAFSCCSYLIAVHIPDSVTKIGDRAFGSCDSAYFIVDPNNRYYTSKSGKLIELRFPRLF